MLFQVGQVNLLTTMYETFREKTGMIAEFYQCVNDLSDYKTMELVLDHIWPFEISLHRGKVVNAVKFIRQEVSDPNLRFWIFDNLGHSRGKIYSVKKALYQFFVEPISLRAPECWKPFQLGLIVLMNFVLGLIKSLSCYNDTFKDLMLIAAVWHISNNILVSEKYKAPSWEISKFKNQCT